jgi:hypothetical protein
LAVLCVSFFNAKSIAARKALSRLGPSTSLASTYGRSFPCANAVVMIEFTKCCRDSQLFWFSDRPTPMMNVRPRLREAGRGGQQSAGLDSSA